jgi:hypothetical protein
MWPISRDKFDRVDDVGQLSTGMLRLSWLRLIWMCLRDVKKGFWLTIVVNHVGKSSEGGAKTFSPYLNNQERHMPDMA